MRVERIGLEHHGDAALGRRRGRDILAVDDDAANSWLPFTGKTDLKRAVADQLAERSGMRYDPETQIVITCGDGDAMVDALFVTTDPGDEVILTDPTYAGVINRVRIVGAVPRLVPLHPESGEWRLDLDALAASVSSRTRAISSRLRTCAPAGPTPNV